MNRDILNTVYDAVMRAAFLNGLVTMRDALGKDTRIVEDLNFDSLARTTLVMELENRLQIVCDNDDAQEAKTLGDVVTICERLLAGRSKPPP